MSNRVYLYSTNFVPGTEVEEREVVGIAEWGNYLPIGFKLLVSGSPKKCKSLAWDDPEVSAIVADYDVGVANLVQFIERVSHPTIPALAEEARQFFAATTNRKRYLLLEPEEFFWLEGGNTDELIAELANLGPSMDKAIAGITARVQEEQHPPGIFARLFGARTPVRRDNSNDMVIALGLGAWTNTLFCQFE